MANRRSPAFRQRFVSRAGRNRRPSPSQTPLRSHSADGCHVVLEVLKVGIGGRSVVVPPRGLVGGLCGVRPGPEGGPRLGRNAFPRRRSSRRPWRSWRALAADAPAPGDFGNRLALPRTRYFSAAAPAPTAQKASLDASRPRLASAVKRPIEPANLRSGASA